MGVFGFQCYRETFLGYGQGWFRGFQYFEFIQIRTSWCRGIGRYFYGIRPGSQVNQHLGRFGRGSIPFRRSVNGTFYLWIIIYFYSESTYTIAVEISFEFIGSGYFPLEKPSPDLTLAGEWIESAFSASKTKIGLWAHSPNTDNKKNSENLTFFMELK